eukprot:361871-Chlamydomonas_euryale.AAC.1
MAYRAAAGRPWYAGWGDAAGTGAPPGPLAAVCIWAASARARWMRTQNDSHEESESEPRSESGSGTQRGGGAGGDGRGHAAACAWICCTGWLSRGCDQDGVAHPLPALLPPVRTRRTSIVWAVRAAPGLEWRAAPPPA